MGFLSLVRVISEVALWAGGLVAPRPPAGGAGQPSRRGPGGPGHAPVHTVVYDRDVPPTPVMLLSATVIRRRLAQISA